MTNFTREELIARGFCEGLDGNWYGSDNQRQRANKEYREFERRREQRSLEKELSDNDTGKVSEFEHDTAGKSKSKGKAKREKAVQNSDPASVAEWLIVITSHRRNHIDPDNLCPKWYIDEIVKEGLLPGDSSRDIVRVEKMVQKISFEESEKTVIEVYKLCST